MTIILWTPGLGWSVDRPRFQEQAIQVYQDLDETVVVRRVRIRFVRL